MAITSHGIALGIVILIPFTITYVYGIRIREAHNPEVQGNNNGKEEDTQSYTLEEIQNVYVRKYLDAFGDIQEKVPGEDTKDAMEMVKLLIIQSWFHSLQPDLKVVGKLFPVNEKTTLEDVKTDVIRKIRNRDKITPAADAILLYVNSIEQDVKNSFKAQADAFNANIDSIVKKVEIENDENKRNELIQENNEKVKELDEVLFYLGFYKIARRMCLQSYVLDFVGETTDKTIVITSTSGSEKREFYMPSLKAGNFWAFVEETDIERDNVEKT